MMQRQDCSGLPGQVGLVELLAMDVVEEIQVGHAGEAGVECRGWPNGLGVWRRSGRRAGGRIVPQAAVLEDFADDLFLAGHDEGDDFHRSAAFWAAQRVGLVDALDEDGPAAAVELGRFDDRRGLVGRRLPRRVR